MRRHAFTLIELLVVVAILAMLVSILLPTMSAARETGRQSACLANLRSIALGVQLYTQQSNDWLPAAEPPLREFPDERHWFMNADLMRQLVVDVRINEDGEPIGPPKARSILTCPSHVAPDRWRDETPLAYSLSFAANGTWGMGGRPDHLEQRRLIEFDRTAEVLAFSDACGTALAPGIVLYQGCPRDNFAFRHADRTDAAFLDGHAAPVRQGDIPFGMNRRYESFWSARPPPSAE
ncbi:MAG: type II secretion system protein [Phycisphaerae bacterium]